RENVTPSGPDHPRGSLSVVRTAVANTSPSTGRPSSTSTRTDLTVPPPGAGLSPGTTASAPPRSGATTTSPRSPEPGSATGGSGGCSATGGSGVVIPGSADGAGSGAVIASGRGASRSSAGARSGALAAAPARPTADRLAASSSSRTGAGGSCRLAAASGLAPRGCGTSHTSAVAAPPPHPRTRHAAAAAPGRSPRGGPAARGDRGRRVLPARGRLGARAARVRDVPHLGRRGAPAEPEDEARGDGGPVQQTPWRAGRAGRRGPVREGLSVRHAPIVPLLATRGRHEEGFPYPPPMTGASGHTRDAAAPPAAARTRMPRDARRAQLLAIAEELFASQGYHHISMDDIADRAGVGKPVLYRHFPSKLDLYLAIVDEQGERLVRAVHTTLDPFREPAPGVEAGDLDALAVDGLAVLEGIVRAYVAYACTAGRSAALLFESDVMRDPVVRARVLEPDARIAGAFADVLVRIADLDAGEALVVARTCTAVGRAAATEVVRPDGA